MRRGSEFTLYDGLGSVTKITDGTGTPSEQITFDAFGRTQNVGGTSSDPYQYKSEYGYRSDGDGAYDQGIMKVGVRYYDPLFGRFITRDKVLSQAAYVYCEGDPVNYVDPDGHTTTKKKLPNGNTQVINTTDNGNGTSTVVTKTYDPSGNQIGQPVVTQVPTTSSGNGNVGSNNGGSNNGGGVNIVAYPGSTVVIVGPVSGGPGAGRDVTPAPPQPGVFEQFFQGIGKFIDGLVGGGTPASGGGKSAPPE